MTTKPPTITELEALLVGAAPGSYPTLWSEHRRLVAEAERAAALEVELRGARAARAERERVASIRKVTLPQVGTDDDAMVVGLNAGLVAREELDGEVTEYRIDGIGFIDPATWARIGEQVRRALALAHRPKAGHACTFHVSEPGAPKGDLLAVHPRSTAPMSMADETYFGAIAGALPLSPLTARWFRCAAVEHQGDRAAAEFCRVLVRRFNAAGLDAMLAERPALTPATVTPATVLDAPPAEAPAPAQSETVAA